MKYAKYAVVVLALALVMGFTAAPAAAEERFTGSFTLTTDAYWGDKLLTPGDYRISVNLDHRPGSHMATITAEGFSSSIVTGASMEEPVSNSSSLLLEKVNGVFVIRQLDAGLARRSLRFVVSKNVRANGEQASPNVKLTMPVTASGY